MKKFHDRIIKVDGEETYLLSHQITDTGILLTVSGPETIYLHEHNVTEFNGEEINLSLGKNSY